MAHSPTQESDVQEVYRITRELGISLEDAAVGDYVIVHVGYALSKLDPVEAEAQENLKKQQAENERKVEFQERRPDVYR